MERAAERALTKPTKGQKKTEEQGDVETDHIS